MYHHRNILRDGSVAVFVNVLLRGTRKMIERADRVNATQAWTGCCTEIEGDGRPWDVVGVLKATVLKSPRRLNIASQKRTLEIPTLLDFICTEPHGYLRFRAVFVVLYIDRQKKVRFRRSKSKLC